MARARVLRVTLVIASILHVVWELEGEISKLGGPGQLYSSSSLIISKKHQEQQEHNDQSDYPTTLSSTNESFFLPEIERFGDGSYKHGTLRTSTTSWKVTDTWVRSCVRNITDTAEVEPFKVASWEMYRLGDCMKKCNHCIVSGPDTSFAKEYYARGCVGKGKKNKERWGNLTVVKEILDLYQDDPAFTEPAKDELVLHFRLGDVIEWSESSVEQMLIQGGTPAHHVSFNNSIRSVYEYLSNIEESGATKVAIRGGSHFPDLYNKSRVYAGCMKRAFEASGYEVSMVLDGSDPDRDFYFMSCARKMIVGIGGYSRLIGRVVKSNGGTVYGRVFGKAGI